MLGQRQSLYSADVRHTLNAFREQSIILAVVCLAAAIFFAGFLRFSRGTWFSGVIAANLVTLTIIFGTFAIIPMSGDRAEIAATLISELPFSAVVICLCVAQAGYLPARMGAPPLVVAVARPKLRLLLVSAGAILPAVWMLAAIFGFIWPSPAVQALAPAPVEFVVFKWILMIPATLFASLAAVLFLNAARSDPLDLRLRLKNIAFAIATFCLAMVALESAVFAGVRVWASEENRATISGLLMILEAGLAITCVVAFLLGAALRYTPAIAIPLAERMATRWLPEQDRFDAHRWRTVVGGVTRGVAIASYRIGAAAERLGLSQSDIERAVNTVQHIAVIQGNLPDTGAITPESARDLHLLQSEVVGDAELTRRLDKIELHGTISRFGTQHAASLHIELRAALDLTGCSYIGGAGRDDRPRWFYLAAVGASDVGFIDASRMKAIFSGEIVYDEVLGAYRGTSASSKETPRNIRSPGRALKGRGGTADKGTNTVL